MVAVVVVVVDESVKFRGWWSSICQVALMGGCQIGEGGGGGVVVFGLGDGDGDWGGGVLLLFSLWSPSAFSRNFTPKPIPMLSATHMMVMAVMIMMMIFFFAGKACQQPRGGGGGG